MLIDNLLMDELFVELVEEKRLQKAAGSWEAVKTADSYHSSLHGGALVFHEIPLEKPKLFDNRVYFAEDVEYFSQSFVFAGVVEIEV